MKALFATIALAVSTTATFAEEMKIEGAYVPMAPPGVMAHAAYFTVENTGDVTRSLIGVSASGYGMTHLHKSAESDGVATMSMIHQIDIAPAQKITLMPGGLHVMLMRPSGPTVLGETVPLTLSFANGEEVNVTATVKEHDAGS